MFALRIYRMAVLCAQSWYFAPTEDGQKRCEGGGGGLSCLEDAIIERLARAAAEAGSKKNAG